MRLGEERTSRNNDSLGVLCFFKLWTSEAVLGTIFVRLSDQKRYAIRAQTSCETCVASNMDEHGACTFLLVKHEGFAMVAQKRLRERKNEIDERTNENDLETRCVKNSAASAFRVRFSFQRSSQNRTKSFQNILERLERPSQATFGARSGSKLPQRAIRDSFAESQRFRFCRLRFR
jgi:hypothetical protein